MAVGKNKRIQGRNKGVKKRVDSMLKKEWYDVVAPKIFKKRQFAKTICNKTIGEKLAHTNLMGRVFEVNLADLKDNATDKESSSYKLKFQVQKVVERNLLTQFYGMEMTTDKLRSLFKKWCSTVEGVIEAKTMDGYILRIFVIMFTTKQKNQLSKNCYAKEHTKKWLRARATAMIKKKVAQNKLNQVVDSLCNFSVIKKLQRRCSAIFPIRDLKIRKVKVIRNGDIKNIMDIHEKVPVSIEDQPRIVDVVQTEIA